MFVRSLFKRIANKHCSQQLTICLDDWAEQKYLEGQGRREVYDYGTPLPTERVILSSVWGVSISLLLGRVFWQVRTNEALLLFLPVPTSKLAMSHIYIVIRGCNNDSF